MYHNSGYRFPTVKTVVLAIFAGNWVYSLQDLLFLTGLCHTLIHNLVRCISHGIKISLMTDYTDDSFKRYFHIKVLAAMN